MTHRYEIDQVVRLSMDGTLSHSHLSPDGVYKITRLLPRDQAGNFHYRVQSSVGERVVQEDQIFADVEV